MVTQLHSAVATTDRMHQTPCSECGRPADVLNRFHLPSTDGPIEHLRTRCVDGHVLTHALTPFSDALHDTPRRASADG